eukprot:2723980-Pyramimonas_sp.AAC.1
MAPRISGVRAHFHASSVPIVAVKLSDWLRDDCRPQMILLAAAIFSCAGLFSFLPDGSGGSSWYDSSSSVPSSASCCGALARLLLGLRRGCSSGAGAWALLLFLLGGA